MTTLDAELEDIEFEKADLMVMDIEGHEFHALKGSSRVLEKLSVLDIEFAPEQLQEHGSNPIELLNLIFDYFDYMYILRENPRRYDKKEALKYLQERLGGRGFLINLVFTKKELPI